jgi:hypothetical protein
MVNYGVVNGEKAKISTAEVVAYFKVLLSPQISRKD